ncbi:hypothetical protein APE_1539.1 [Aeropyrum pernix K1]|uniref:Uncharacterized protein n=1 Tax=Aeropyrum pernix (strain ATCC 700893 / DSM 11879 / JCM 9820 / NBRC 100138 / K1) TaxID=272557 RepID=Q9YBR0_AERPE|nr:hypothetical protein [Aeropyrum pernix]BAA80538.2 hypothetical protein APE_1539.1 [Aeropyrum pernix K1]
MASSTLDAGLPRDVLEAVRGSVELVEGRPVFRDGARELLESLRLRVVDGILGEALGRAVEWVHIFKDELETARRAAGLRGVLLPKELRSFIEDPRGHLAKKLFQYSIDLARGKLSPEEFLAKARSALNTSLATNLRSIYQHWVFLALVAEYGRRGASIVYPDHGFLHIERQGRQRGGSIPANAVIRLPGAREASFYLEAPRPIGWGDSRGLERAWSLYTSLRPDMIIYGGRVLDMVEWADGRPRIKRPSVVVEFKELEDWYERVRYLKGPLVKRFSAEEWYARWFEGLKTGLADILGIEPGRREERREGVRVREHRLVLLYREVYKPDLLVLVSRTPVPGEVRRDLESEGVAVIDGVEIGSREPVGELASELEPYFEKVVDTPLDEVEHRLWLMGVEADRRRLEEALATLALENLPRLASMLESRLDTEARGGEASQEA